jgi:ATP-dependent Lhr-like helicase
MSEELFTRLAPFIQDYIYRAKWDKLRYIQKEAIKVILDTEDHILITSGTASGKTEAAFLPILTELYDNPPSSIGVIYIGPLKALINDQFYRLEGLLEESQIPVQSWHGDISQSKKQRFLKQARGVLQITPEALEAMLSNHPSDLGRLFGDLRYVVLDEVHSLIDSDRGRQVMCLLQRLARYQVRPARRVGLSATLGEPELAMNWLKGGTKYNVQHINDSGGGSQRDIAIGVEHFIIDNRYFTDNEGGIEISLNESDADIELIDQKIEMYRLMYRLVDKAHKTIIFAGSRSAVEEAIYNLRRINGSENEDQDQYFVHHGSISPVLREQAEDAMRDPDQRACIAATLTLELGIDIGHLDQVLQVNTTNTVSSFVQRLGRTGRRGGQGRMFFFTYSDMPENNASLESLIPWSLLQNIAMIQLYAEEKWIEPPLIPSLPMSLLYHQTMSIVKSATEISPPDLAERVLTLSPFKAVSVDDYRELLNHLIEIQHLELIEGGGLIIGAKSERMVNYYTFYAMFEQPKEYSVREGAKEIGSIESIPAIDDRFRLAGRTWKVLRIDEERQIIYAERVLGEAMSKWGGGGVTIHTRIVQRIGELLAEDREYPYLQSQASNYLKQARILANDTGMNKETIIKLGEKTLLLLPWLGTRELQTMCLLFNYVNIPVSVSHTFFLRVERTTLDELKEKVQFLLNNIPTREQLIKFVSKFVIYRNKYDRFVPEMLLRKSYVDDQLEIDSVVARLHEMIS